MGASHYETLEGRTELEKYFIKEKIVGEGNCAAASLSFMNDRMYVPKDLTQSGDYTTVSNLLDSCPYSTDVSQEAGIMYHSVVICSKILEISITTPIRTQQIPITS